MRDKILHRRSVLAGLAATLAAPSLRAQERYPSRPITLIVPFPAGGSTDVIGRVVAQALHAQLKVPVVVENRSGAAGVIGTAAIARANPDGYTIGMGTASTLAINPAAYQSLPYDVLTDLAPVGMIAAVPNIMVINPALPCEDMASFIAYAKLGPHHMNYASSGNGSVSHLMGEQFKVATGTEMLHVPYRGVAPALRDVLSGHVKVLFDNLPTSLSLVKRGRLRALAVSAPQRLAVLPDVPTFAELKMDDLNWMAFFGLVAPAQASEPVVMTLNDALNAALDDEKVRETLTAQQAAVASGAPSAFGALIGREFARMKRATQAARISID